MIIWPISKRTANKATTYTSHQKPRGNVYDRLANLEADSAHRFFIEFVCTEEDLSCE